MGDSNTPSDDEEFESFTIEGSLEDLDRELRLVSKRLSGSPVNTHPVRLKEEFATNITKFLPQGEKPGTEFLWRDNPRILFEIKKRSNKTFSKDGIDSVSISISIHLTPRRLIHGDPGYYTFNYFFSNDYSGLKLNRGKKTKLLQKNAEESIRRSAEAYREKLMNTVSGGLPGTKK